MRVARLARICLNAADPESLTRFYVDTLGFTRRDPQKPEACALALGPTRLDLIHATGRLYPADVPGWSLLFQHCAIVTADMAQAMAKLEGARGWTAISTNGPERLPPSSGGVIAFKFRDPEGHPLEFLQFPHAREAGALFQRIDHSAISVAETQRSVAFYKGLGLSIGGSSMNVGPEQARLDDVPGAQVDVSALDLPTGSKPHVELLCYRGAFDRDFAPACPNDVAATRLVFCAVTEDALNTIRETYSNRLIPHGGEGLVLRDPDGHLVEIELGANS